MKSNIIYIENQNNKSAGLVKALNEEILLPKYNSRVLFSPNSFKQDLLCVVEIEGLKVGLMDHQDPTQSPSHLLDFFSNKACNLIFCTSINNLDLKSKIDELVNSSSVNLMHFKNIWSSSFESKELVDYQLEKWMNIIHMFANIHSSSSSSFKKKNSNNSEEIISS